MIGNLNSSGNSKVEVQSGVVNETLFVSGLGGNEPGATFPNTVVVRGGQIMGGVEVSGSRDFSMGGGLVTKIKASGIPGGARPNVHLAIGTVLGTVDVDAANFDMFDGVIGGVLQAVEGSRVGINGGRIGGNLNVVQPGTTVLMTAGQVDGFLIAANQAQVTMAGGRIILNADINSGRDADLDWRHDRRQRTAAGAKPSLR